VRLKRWIAVLCVASGVTPVYALDESEALKTARSLYESGQYFKSARYAFDALSASSGSQKAEAYAWAALGLTKAGLYNSASYFFIQALETKERSAIRRALTVAHELIENLGPDLFRKAMQENTSDEDYGGVHRSAYFFVMGKAALLSGDERKALQYLNGVHRDSYLGPHAHQLRGTARAISGEIDPAIAEFKICVDESQDQVSRLSKKRGNSKFSKLSVDRYEDLRWRCQASIARTLYQANRFEEADREWDRIPKSSFVWTDILFEQAWNAFAQREYNRALGRLVTYKAPLLMFVYNSEIEVLRAQSYLALCLYEDAGKEVDAFEKQYTAFGQELKNFIERNADRIDPFYAEGKRALEGPLHAKTEFMRVLNRFARGPYFQTLSEAENLISGEVSAIRQFDSMQPGVGHQQTEGFPGFLRNVLQWRLKSVRQLGGAFVKNSLLDYHAALISDFEKMAFIKLEMLGRSKDKLLYGKAAGEERSRGNVLPRAKSHQYTWGFNGEFWNDELGDYVFGLESKCGGED
jgi:hypothetical protein